MTIHQLPGTASPSKDARVQQLPDDTDALFKTYGDLLYDLCESLMRGPVEARLAFHSIFKEIKSRRRSEQYKDHQRAWLLSIACETLVSLGEHHAQKPTPVERIQLDSLPSPQARLKKFESYFHRLDFEDKLLLLLRDKYGIPFPEIASAMDTPEGSLKIRRQQSLRLLEDWLWENE